MLYMYVHKTKIILLGGDVYVSIRPYSSHLKKFYRSKRNLVFKIYTKILLSGSYWSTEHLYEYISFLSH